MAETAKIMTLEMLNYYHSKETARTATEDAKTLEAAKEYADGLVEALPAAAEYSIVKAETATEGFAASYNLTKDGVATGTTINIPKDYLVKSGSIKTVDTADTPVAGYKVGDKYIDFIVNTVDGEGNESHLYLLVSELVDAYTAGAGIEISADNVVSIVTQDGTKEVGGITDEDYAEFKGAVTTANDAKAAIEAINNADTGILAQAKEYADSKDEAIEAAQSAADTAQGEVDALETLVGTIPEGATATNVVDYAEEIVAALEANGYDDTEVRGLISDNTTAIEKNATDIAAVKETADSAVQEVVSDTANGTIAVDGTDVAVTGLGTAAYKADTDFEVAGAATEAENNAKTYSDGLNTAMDTRVTALEEATSNQVTTDDIDALFAGT